MKKELVAKETVALRAAEHALRTAFGTDDVGWTHMNISVDYHEADYYVTIEGNFFGQRTPHFYKGSVEVLVYKNRSSYIWVSGGGVVRCEKPHGGYPDSLPGVEIQEGRYRGMRAIGFAEEGEKPYAHDSFQIPSFSSAHIPA